MKKRLKKKCKICNKTFYISPSWIGRRGFCCSRKCYYISRIGKSNGNKGKPSWNKGLKGVMKPNKTSFKKGNIPWIIGKEMLRGERHPNWKGGRLFTNMGYIQIYSPDHPFATKQGYVLEHRLVVEKQIGRYLKPEEISHHLKAKNNNQPNMLMVFVNHSAHRRFHCNPESVKSEEIIFDGRKI